MNKAGWPQQLTPITVGPEYYSVVGKLSGVATVGGHF